MRLRCDANRRLLFLLLVCGVAQSQPPAPTPQKIGRNEQQSTQAGRGNAQNHKYQSALPTGIPEAAHKDEPQTQDKQQRPPSNDASNTVIAIATVIIALATVGQVIIYGRQSGYLKRGLNISIRQARIANRSALAAKASADAAKASVESAREQMELMERQTKATEETAKAAMISAEAASRSIDGLRANVSIETVRLSEHDIPAITTATRIYIVLVNHGGTSAEKVRIGVVSYGSDGESQRPSLEPTVPFSIGPNGGTREVCLSQAVQWLKTADFAAIQSGTFAPLLEITVEYEDVFGKGRWIEASGYFHPRSGWQVRKQRSGALPYQ